MQVWVASGQSFTQRLLKSYCRILRLLQKSSRKGLLLTSPNAESNFEAQIKHLKEISEITVMAKFYLCFHDFSEFSEL